MNALKTLDGLIHDAATNVSRYEGNQLISTEREYRFKVTSDVSYTALFEDGDEPLEGTDIWGFIQMYWMWVLAILLLLIVLIVLVVIILRLR